MSTETPDCPQCSSQYVYQDRDMWTCPECAHEWSASSEVSEEKSTTTGLAILDANGNQLKDGDTVTVIKTLKVKGSTSSVKAGTKVKNIRLNLDAADGHDISCKIDGFGAMGLKSEFVKKA